MSIVSFKNLTAFIILKIKFSLFSLFFSCHGQPTTPKGPLMGLCHSSISYFPTYNFSTMFSLCLTPPLSIQGYQTTYSFPFSLASSSIDGIKTISIGSLDKSITLYFGSPKYQFVKNSVFSLKDPKPSFSQKVKGSSY